MIKYGLLLLALASFVSSCKDKKLSPQHLTTASVIREVENLNANSEKQINQQEKQKQTYNEETTYRASGQDAQYYIIVASFLRSERSRAEKLTNGLKAKGYPAKILDAKGRLRVSIENLPTEQEAKERRDRYREITDKQDIWILKTEE